MKIRWGSEELKYFTKPIKKAERIGDWFWWLVLAVCLWAVIWMGYKLYCLYQIRLWIETL